MSSALDPQTLLRRWHDAVNAGDVPAALACCAEDVAVGGPHGTGRGHELMRAWLNRTGIRLEPRGEFQPAGEGRFVVEELARWTATGAPEGAPVEPTATWVLFGVADGLITSVARFASRDEVPTA